MRIKDAGRYNQLDQSWKRIKRVGEAQQEAFAHMNIVQHAVYAFI
jgi:hypothetical protein